MTISPTILIIAALIVVMLIVVAVREIRELSNENETLTRQIVAYMTAFGKVDAEVKALSDKIDAAGIEINPRTGLPYKTPKKQREACKRWNAKHPERNYTENSKASRHASYERNKEKNKEKFVNLWFNGHHTVKKEHCRRVMGKNNREKWEVRPEFRDLYSWCKGVQDETP